MKKKKVRRKGFENYERVDMPNIVTFGTTLFMRNDKQAIKIVFPAGQMVTFAPQDEIDKEYIEENPVIIERVKGQSAPLL